MPVSGEPDSERMQSPRNRSGSGLTSFVGRAQDSGRIFSLVTDPDVRLVTVTGPGGVGKTRIVEEMIPALRNEFRDGVSYAESTSIIDPLLVLAVVLLASGGERNASQATLDMLCD